MIHSGDKVLHRRFPMWSGVFSHIAVIGKNTGRAVCRTDKEAVPKDEEGKPSWNALVTFDPDDMIGVAE